MMDCLIVWAALGPVLAFIAGAVAVAWWEDEEEEALPSWEHPGPMRGTLPGGPGAVMSLDSLGRDGPCWNRASGHAGGYSSPRMRSCVQCGRMEERP
ncbi:hypothetical protein [Inquilinus limosus]|uniref:Uncharacterized protein n=1 Tax=Inquilinus limosus TaxID=171674 RepID=A0A211ZG01_9PROT|nr:hypothetical protein [Inquilinus limosus]OWJ64201.1 hypothetical protein BWR60_25870 [Inquilinus limosus]